MARLGDDTKPTQNIEWFGLNSTNQIGIALTLPAGGPWNITHLGAWLAGRGMSADYKLCLWTGAGTLARSSSGGTVASQALALGNLAEAYQAITPYEVAGGTTVIVGFWRHPSHSVQNGFQNGGSHYHDTTGSAPSSLSGWSSHTGAEGYYLDYELANTAPDPPTIDEPDQNEVVNDQTPLIDWTFHDDDAGDSQTAYEVEIDNNSDFSSLVVNTGKVVSATTSYTSGVSLTRGTTYYARVRTWDESDVVSGWSSTRTFKIASLPTVSVTSPGADGRAAPMYYTTGSDDQPRFRIGWSFTCPDGGTQSSVIIRIKDAAGSSTLHTHNYSGTATTRDITGYAPTNGTEYTVTVQATCSHGVQSTETSATSRSMRARWGRASYRADLTSAPLTLSVTTSSTANSGQVLMEYASSAATTPEPTDWKATIAEVSKQRYIWHRVTLIPQSVASPTSPTLNSVTFQYSNNVFVPDGWVLASAAQIDQGTFVYGTQSIKHSGDGAVHITEQTVTVTPDTDYVFSGRVKTQGNPVATLKIRNLAGDDLASVAAIADTDWIRYATPIFNSGSETSVKVILRTGGAGGTAAWFDALKLEASRVVTPWTPGFLGEAVVLDAGGLQVDAEAGGVFRLKTPQGGTISLEDGGLRFSAGGDASPSGDTHGLQIGSTTSLNLRLDVNEILALSNGVVADLHLNADGGYVKVGQNTPGALLLYGGVVMNGITSASVGTNQNNYNPSGLHTSFLLSITATAAIQITGMDSSGAEVGALHWIRNAATSGSNTITLVYESASSTDVNRFRNAGAANRVLSNQDSCLVGWFGSRWLILG